MLLFYAIVFCLILQDFTVSTFFTEVITTLGNYIPDTEERIRRLGYPVEKHEVFTEDGYGLTMFRIPKGLKQNNQTHKPLLLMHGLVCSSDCYVINGPEKSLGILLADAGYDVWLGNNRGISYSRSHVNKLDDKHYWNFSFHELGYYDLPAMIDYILSITGEKKLSYVGHSQGTTIFFVMTSTRPEYNKKVRVMSALAPVAFMNYTDGFFRTLSGYIPMIESTTKMIGVYQIMDGNFGITRLQSLICKINERKCRDFISYIGYLNTTHFEESLIPEILEVCPTPASLKQLHHFSQLIHNDGKFTWFDYGAENMKVYKSENPPEYNLTSITTPILLYYGPGDVDSPPEAVQYLFSRLKSAKYIKEIPGFLHLDFMWAANIKSSFADDMIKMLNMF